MGLGALEKAFGFTTLYNYPVHDSGTSVSAFGRAAEATQLATVFSGDNGVVVGRYVGGAVDGEAAVLELKVGLGKLVLVGAPVCGAESQPKAISQTRRGVNEAVIKAPPDLRKQGGEGLLAHPDPIQPGRGGEKIEVLLQGMGCNGVAEGAVP